MAATLFLTNKSVKILVLNNDDFLFNLEKKFFKEQLKNDITFAGKISGEEKEIVAAVKPDVIIDFLEGETESLTLEVSSSRTILHISNVDTKMLQKYHEIFLLIDQIKPIKSQLNLD